VASWDEPFSVYGLLAEDMILAEDRLSVMFKLRAEARSKQGAGAAGGEGGQGGGPAPPAAQTNSPSCKTSSALCSSR